jgi:hypothetical protein
MDVETPSSKLANGFTLLKSHIDGSKVLSDSEIKEQDSIIQAKISAIGIKKEIIAQAFDLVAAYETVLGPLFLNDTGKVMQRKPEEGKEIHYAMFYIQDAITRAYCSANLEKFPDVYNGAMFKTSEYFPGKVDPPSDPSGLLPNIWSSLYERITDSRGIFLKGIHS